MEDSELSSSSEDLKWDGFSSSLILSKASFSLEKKTKVNLGPQRLAPVHGICGNCEMISNIVTKMNARRVSS